MAFEKTGNGNTLNFEQTWHIHACAVSAKFSKAVFQSLFTYANMKGHQKRETESLDKQWEERKTQKD